MNSIWQIHKKTGFINKIENWRFMEDLQEVKSENGLSEKSVVLYLGSDNDTSVRNIFPQTLHFDQSKPKRMPDDFRFMLADFKELPIEDSSVELAIFKCSMYNQSEPASIEMNRILKLEGKVLVYGSMHQCDFSQTPKDLDIAGDQNRALRIIENFRKNGFVFRKIYHNETAMFERGKMDDDKIRFYQDALSRNKHHFYDYIQSVSFEEATSKTQGSHLEYILGLEWGYCYPVDSFRNLARIKEEAPPEAFRRIKILLIKLLNEVIRNTDAEGVRRAEAKLKILEAV